MEMITDDEFASGYHTASPFNFQHFNVSRLEMKKNGTTYPRGGYTPKWADENYIYDYMKFQGQLGNDTGDKCIQLTPHEWAHGYTLFSFKLTPGPIGSGVAGPRSHSTGGNVRLELSFAQPTPANLKIILLYQTLSVLEIDLWNNVVLT